jgi:hypothetical protein
LSTYSTLLAHGVLQAAVTTLFTVPDGQTCVVRDLEVITFSGAPASFAFSLTVSGLNSPIYNVAETVNAQAYQWSGRVVIPGGGTLMGVCTTPSNGFTASGYLLTD